MTKRRALEREHAPGAQRTETAHASDGAASVDQEPHGLAPRRAADRSSDHLSDEDPSEVEQVPLSRSAEYVLEEARMVLPGLQALFGFQLVVVFAPGFDEKLTAAGRELHLFAMALVALSIGLIMTPAAYHRQTDTRRISAHFVRLSTRLLLCSLMALGLGLSLEFFLIASTIMGTTIGLWSGVGLGLAFAALWFLFPRLVRRKRA